MEAKSTLQISEELGRDYDSVLSSRAGFWACLWDFLGGGGGGRRGVCSCWGEREERGGWLEAWEGDKPPVLTIVKRGKSRKYDLSRDCGEDRGSEGTLGSAS